MSISILACGDRTIEDFQRERVAEELKKLSSYAGIFEGDLVVVSSLENLGKLMIELQPDTQLRSGDGFTVTRQVGIKASVRVLESEGGLKSFNFSEGFFDVEEKIFQIKGVGKGTRDGEIPVEM